MLATIQPARSLFLPQPPPSALLATLPRRKTDLKAFQGFEYILVLDVEATCEQGTKFAYANEIIEWPVCLLRWTDRDDHGRASSLELVDEFRSFVRPTFRPRLSKFCKELTSITQPQVDSADTFPVVIEQFRKWLIAHGLVCPDTGKPLKKFLWCTDGPFDIRDFVVKQCFISKVEIPIFMRHHVMNVRAVVTALVEGRKDSSRPKGTNAFTRRISLNIPAQLQALDLPSFEGHQHSGIDDTRNIARIVMELTRRGFTLRANVEIDPHRRWPWMGKRGKILEENL